GDRTPEHGPRRAAPCPAGNDIQTKGTVQEHGPPQHEHLRQVAGPDDGGRGRRPRPVVDRGRAGVVGAPVRPGADSADGGALRSRGPRGVRGPARRPGRAGSTAGAGSGGRGWIRLRHLCGFRVDLAGRAPRRDIVLLDLAPLRTGVRGPQRPPEEARPPDRRARRHHRLRRAARAPDLLRRHKLRRGPDRPLFLEVLPRFGARVGPGHLRLRLPGWGLPGSAFLRGARRPCNPGPGRLRVLQAGRPETGRGV
ncbi:MAG: hypothetical protein AVDCRST_MAG12-1048, partial [uncultured Rubrobacteraceae bacterium]